MRYMEGLSWPSCKDHFFLITLINTNKNRNENGKLKVSPNITYATPLRVIFTYRATFIVCIVGRCLNYS